MRLAAVVFLLVVSAAYASAQQPAKLSSFGFGAGVVSHSGAQPAAEFSASLLFSTRPLPLQLTGGSWVADARTGNAYERDAFVGALATAPLTRFVRFGVGPELHSFGSHFALGGRLGVELPFARTGAAGLEFFTRTSLMRTGTQWAAGAALRLAPWKGGLRLGERMRAPALDLDAAGSWEGILQQLTLLQDETSPLQDVLATRTSVLMRFSTADESVLKPMVARIGRVLNGSSTPLYITIHGPAPAELAAAVTSGGFPAERIGFVSAGQITLQATRQPPVSAARSEQ